MKRLIQEKQRMSQLAGLVKEGYGDDRYEMECRVDLTYLNTKYKGMQVDDAKAENIRVSFLIDIEGRSWGIKSMNVYDVQGPSELEISMECFDNVKDDYQTESVTVPLDWDRVVMNKIDNLGHIGINNEIEVTISNDPKGNIVVEKIEVQYNSL